MPVIRKEAVNNNKWLTSEEFDKLVIATNMIPGPSVVESLSYIAMKVLGKTKGMLITTLAILPHVLFAFTLFVLADKFLPTNYLYVISFSVMPVIIGILIVFGFRYIKMANKELAAPLWILLFIFTIAFTLFVPAPWNIPAIVMVAVIVMTFLISFIKEKKGGK